MVVRRRLDGTVNLPAGGGTDAEPAALRIGRLDVPNLAIELRDDQAEASLQIPALALLLTPDDGSVSLDMPAEVRVGRRQTYVSQLRGHAQFDGRVLRVAEVDLATDEAAVTVDGAFEVLTGTPRLDLRLGGTGDIARLAGWGLTDTDLPQGTLAFSGSVAGPTDDLDAQIELSAERVTWRDVVTEDVFARVHVDPAAAEIQELRARFAEGVVTATAMVPVAGDGAGHVAASWSDVDFGSAVSAVVPDLGLVPSARLSGDLEIAGVLTDPTTWTASSRLPMVPGRNARGRISAAGEMTLDVRDGTWRLGGEPTVGGIASIQIAVGGPLGEGSETSIAAGPIAGTLRLLGTEVPGLLAALRTVGIITTTAEEMLTAGTVEANMDVSGRVADPVVGTSVIVRDLVGAQVVLPSLVAHVEGRPLQPRLVFSAEAPGATLAGQPLDRLLAAGRLTDTSIVLDELSARQPGSGLVTGSGAYDLNSAEYSASIEGADWALTPTAEQPLTGSLSGGFVVVGTVMNLSGTGHVTLTNADWQGTPLGDSCLSGCFS